MTDKTHWITAHDPQQGYVEVIRAQPLSQFQDHEAMQAIFATTSVPVTKELLSEGSITRPPFGPFPPEDYKVLTLFCDIPPQKESDPITWHRTETLDIDVCLFGELTHFLASGEKIVLKPGDSLVQRGTNHAWANFTDKPARMVCTLIKSTDDAIQVKGEALRNYFDLEGKVPTSPTDVKA